MTDAIRSELNCMKAINAIKETMRKCGAPLDDSQEAVMAGCVAIWLDTAYQQGYLASKSEPIVLKTLAMLPHPQEKRVAYSIVAELEEQGYQVKEG